MSEYSLINSDNIFKFICTAGGLMLLFAIVYPIEKKQKLEIEANELQKDINVLSKKIELDVQVTIEKTTKIDSLLKYTKDVKLKNIYQSQKDKLVQNYDSIVNVNLIETEKIKGDKERIFILKRHINDFYWWSIGCKIFGSILFSVGIVFWFKKELKSSSTDPNQSI